MLSKHDKALMKVIYSRAIKNEDETFVARPIDILNDIPYTSDFACGDLEPTIHALSLDDYFEYAEVEQNGDKAYKIALHSKGHAFIREIESEQRAIKFKIVLSVAGVVGAFILTRLLTFLFN